MNDLISVIIPAYNAQDTISQCVESVLNQTYPSKEIIVVDDGSTDCTIEKIKKYAGIKIEKMLHTGNPSSARNAGLRISAGKYISFIDADDFWEKDVLEELMKKMISSTDCSAVYGDLIFKGGVADGESVHYLRAAQSGKVFNELLRCNFIPMHPCLITKETIDKIGGFDENPNLMVSEDYDFWLRIAYLSKIEYCPCAVGYYRITNNSRFNKTEITVRNKCTLAVIKKIKKMFNIDNPYINKKMAVLNFTIAKNHFKNKFFIHIFPYFFKGIFYSAKYYLKRYQR